VDFLTLTLLLPMEHRPHFYIQLCSVVPPTFFFYVYQCKNKVVECLVMNW